MPTDDFDRSQGNLLGREVTGRDTLYERGQQQQRQDADDVHQTDGQEEVLMVEVGVHGLDVVA